MPQSGGRQQMCREIQRLEITFRDALATFKAGDMLSGTVQMDVVQEFKTKGGLIAQTMGWMTMSSRERNFTTKSCVSVSFSLARIFYE